MQQTQIESAVRQAFQSSPLNRMISDNLTALHGNSNGTTFVHDGDGGSICLDESGELVKAGTALLEAVMGRCTPQNALLIADVSVNGIGFCLSMTGPPVSEATSWSVTLREDVNSADRKEISAAVNV